MRRTLVIAGIVLLVAAGGIVAYTRLRPQSATARADPALTVALAISTLERGGTYRLSDEQVAAVLPLLRVLRDTDPNDLEASRVLAREIMAQLTAVQRAELDRVREQAQRRRQEQGGPGALGPGPGGAPGQAGGRSRAEIRQRLLGRLIEVLENR